ncbi:MAG: septal ring lytic transglycosylase RlpA family protein [Cellvibrionaceae bacterium]
MQLATTVKTMVLFGGLLTLAACVGPVQVVERDSGPDQAMDVAHIPDAVPRRELRTAAGNKSPYTVLGKTYQVMASADNFSERGLASWYGRKFHGRRTSNGEVYDMYGMTAAHKTLPIPTFVQVTNLENGKQVVVRVNDRGPFHDGRVIDLTYAAAKKLDFVDKGTARVEVVAINPDTWAAQNQANAFARSGEPLAPAPRQSAGYQLPANTFLQAGAFGSRESATALRNKLAELTSYPVFVSSVKTMQTLFRVRIGPITDNWELLNLQELIQQHNLGIPHMVQD